MRLKSLAVPILGAFLGGCAAAVSPMGSLAPEPGYVALVASEAADVITRVRFTPGAGLWVESRREVGVNPAEMESPHGLAVAPAGDFYYVTIAHGTPQGTLWRIDVRTEERAGQATLGLFPATIGVTPDGEHAFITNFNLHGDPVPSSVSKVHLPSMTEVARTETCVMPHGSRVDPSGARHYSVCMMDDVLVELDVATADVSRVFSVEPGSERPLDALPAQRHAEHATADSDACSPTWAEPGAGGEFVYIACNAGGYVLEIEAATWRLARRLETGPNPYNLAVSPDGRLLLATLKNRTQPALEVVDLESGRSLARVPSTSVLTHGVAVTPDSRYAFVSVEGVGAEPGKVDLVDLQRFERVASVDVGQQAGGIDVIPER